MVTGSDNSTFGQEGKQDCDKIKLLDDSSYILNGYNIELDQVPKFSTRAEADKYVDKCFSAVKKAVDNRLIVSRDDLLENKQLRVRGTNGIHTCLVSSLSLGLGLCSVDLYVEYMTSGPNNTGTITYCNSYSSISGFTNGIGYEQTSSYCYVTGSGKDIYASASGDVIVCLSFNGFLEIHRENITLSGMCAAIH